MQTLFSRVAVALCAVTFSGSALAQSEDAPVYQFKTLADLTATEVKGPVPNRHMLELLHHKFP